MYIIFYIAETFGNNKLYTTRVSNISRNGHDYDITITACVLPRDSQLIKETQSFCQQDEYIVDTT